MKKTAILLATSRTRAGDSAPFPQNLHISVSSPASPAEPLRERVEQKYFVLPHRMDQALALLRRTCRPDHDHAADQVNSLYFDTYDLDQYERSDSGDLAKDKIRIRWYGDRYDPHRAGGQGRAHRPARRDDRVQVWLELKSRRGFASTKQRVALEVPRTALLYAALSEGIVPPATLVQTMAGFGFHAHGRLCPVIAISYRRHRFVEPQTGFRISLDTRVHSSAVMPAIGCGERGLVLPGAIVEVKGPTFDLPPALRRLTDLGCSWTRYSKYSASLDGHAAARGSVSRLWPSGLMETEPGTLSPVTRTSGSSEPRSSRFGQRLAEGYDTD